LRLRQRIAGPPDAEVALPIDQELDMTRHVVRRTERLAANIM
jgi:hypothetical protein